MIIAGRKVYRRALDTYAECLKKNEWPGWPDRIDVIGLSQWRLNELGAGQYNLLTEEQTNGPETKQYIGTETDWEELEKEARDTEG